MSIPDYARTNFQTLLRAAMGGDLALMECTEIATGETRYVICAVGRRLAIWPTAILSSSTARRRHRHRHRGAGRRRAPFQPQL